MKKRLDVLLFEKGICRSRAEAQDLLVRGLVVIDGTPATKASKTYEEDFFVSLQTQGKIQIRATQFASRGGYKLEYALEHFNLKDKIVGKECLDIGSSTGGFTEVLLKSDARYVTAVDVGTGQFDQKLLYNKDFINKIDLHENTDIRNFETEKRFDCIVCDVSFVSLTEILPVIQKFSHQGTVCVVLVKPQFEVGREYFKKGTDGVVKDKVVRMQVLEKIIQCAKDSGFTIGGCVESPIHGRSGNVEYLLYLKK